MVPAAASVCEECLFRVAGGRRGTELGIRPLGPTVGKLDPQHMQGELLMMFHELHSLHKGVFCGIPVVIDNECRWLEKKITENLHCGG